MQDLMHAAIQCRLMPLLGIPIVKGPAMKECIGITSGSHYILKRNLILHSYFLAVS